MQFFSYALSVLLGLTLGSFLNVVIYRLPRGESLARPGSHCPKCGTAIRWHDNIPVVSWFVLRGRCRTCRARISVRYPLVEAMTGIAFGLAMWRFGLTWPLVVAWAFIAAMLTVAFIDYDHMIIPNKIVLPGALVGLLASVALNPQKWWVYLVGSVGAAAFVFMLVVLWPGGGMGGGDVTLALFVGAVLGAGVVVAFFTAFLVGSIFVVCLLVVLKHTSRTKMMVVVRQSRKMKIPFGPFLAVGAVLAVFLGESILRSYVGFCS